MQSGTNDSKQKQIRPQQGELPHRGVKEKELMRRDRN
jgi:hypothetical protein